MNAFDKQARFGGRRAALGALGAAALAGVLPARAQGKWPDGPIRLVTPTPPGVGIDPMARLYAEHVGRLIKTPVVVENRPGAGGMLGTDVVAKSPPSGQTLLMAVGATFTTTPFLFPKLPYNPQKDLVPIAQLYGGGSFLLARPGFPAGSVRELIALAKARPRALNYASHGPGSTSHMFTEQMQNVAGIELQHVPYKGSFITDLLAGVVDIGFEPPSSAIAHIRAGKVKVLAYTGPTRSKVLPDVPVLAETLPGLEFSTWVGVWGPSGLPDALVARLHGLFRTATAEPALAQMLYDASSEPIATPQAQIAAVIDREAQATVQLIKTNNIRLD
ncbi:MAG: tripartite tricarboxylate transporter substrate-binding protein [Pseudomonadota bacterium]